MAGRYDGRSFILNNDHEYKKKFFNDRGVEEIVQYDTAEFGYPDVDDMQDIETVIVRWNATSKLYNLADRYYGSPSYWWVIALFNKKPTEAEFKVGDTVYIPTSLDTILPFYGV